MPLFPLRFLPAAWKCTVTVEQSGGKDERNNPRPSTTFTWPEVLVAPRSTSDPLDYSDLVENRTVLYGEPPVGHTLTSTDVIIIPEGSRMAGRWVVRGRPAEWPYGLEVTLDRENATTDRPARRAT